MDSLLHTDTAFDSFYREHRARLVATLNAATRCGAEKATEAVDEAFVRALARWRRVERMEAPAGWVFTVARNQLRRTRSRQAREEALTGAMDVNTTSVQRATDWDLWNAVAQLPDRERTAIALRYLGDFTEREVAEIMGIAPGTVSATLHNGRRRLAETIENPMEVPK